MVTRVETVIQGPEYLDDEGNLQPPLEVIKPARRSLIGNKEQLRHEHGDIASPPGMTADEVRKEIRAMHDRSVNTSTDMLTDVITHMQNRDYSGS